MPVDHKKYQIFVSSTYEDLRPERQEIMHALLELDCIPSGMELFPAASEDQWTLIKGVIDDCDYYIVVIGGRYGSLGPDNISYTEMEYRYAISKGKPVIAFLHKDPASLPAKHTEQVEEGRKRLDSFRKLAQQKMCKHWTSPQELGSVVSRSLIMLQKSHPGIGWIRGNQASNEEATAEILKLRKRIDQLEAERSESQIDAPKGTEKLSQGEDNYNVDCTFQTTSADDQSWTWTWQVKATWNQLFSEISPLMLHEASALKLRERLSQFLKKMLLRDKGLNKRTDYKGHKNLSEVAIDRSDFEAIWIQLNALGLITQSVKQRSSEDHETYWTLTPFGVTTMNRLRAVTRK